MPVAYLLHHIRWISTDERIGGNILEDNAASRYNCARSNLNAGRDERTSRYPTAAANGNRSYFQFKVFPSKIVVACAKIGALTDADIRFNQNLREAQNADFLANPDVLAYDQTPWEGNVHIGANDDSTTDLCAERAQEKCAE